MRKYMSEYEREWIEQRLYSIQRELDLEGDVMSSKSYARLTMEYRQLNQILEPGVAK